MRHKPEIWSDGEIVRSFTSRSAAGKERLIQHASFLAQELNLLNASRVVDIGIGDGALALELLKQSKELTLTGIDYSGPLLRLATRRLKRFSSRCHLIECDAFDASDLQPNVDAILLSRVLHHMELPEACTLLSVLSEHSPDTKLIISERWAFHPASETEAALRRVRLAIAAAMFPGVGEFHHLRKDYVDAARYSGLKEVKTVWFERQASIEHYKRKIDKWVTGTERTSLLDALGPVSRTVNLPTLLMVLNR